MTTNIFTCMGQKAVVTGGAGFIGSHIVDALLERGDEVHVVDDLSAGKREYVNPKASFYKLDIRDREALISACAGADHIFHVAALPRVQFSIENPLETHEVNVTGTLNVLYAAAENRVKKVVFSSSSSVYGDQDTMPLVETMSANPKSPYALHKYIGERYCSVWSEVFSVPTVSLRYFNVYGPRQTADGSYPLVTARFLKQREEGEKLTITGDGEQTRDFTHVRDVVRANLLAADSEAVGRGEAINIGAGSNISINRIAELVGGEVEHIEPRFEPRHTLADNSKAGTLLGWEPTVSIEEGMAELKRMQGVT